MSEWLSVKVASKQQEAVDIVSFTLIQLEGEALPPFAAGAHIDVSTPSGLIRQYSLCNTPGDTHYQIAVLNDSASRGGSVEMHQLHEGMSIKISAPRNTFPLTPTAKQSLLFAGGIGVTPLLSMAQQLSRDAAEFQMHYCARSLDRMAFVNHIKRSSFARRVSLHLDNGAFAQKLAPEKELSQPNDGTHIYICGPSGFMDWIANVALNIGWPNAQLHREYFSMPATQTEAAAFEVQVASTGAVFFVEPDQSITNVLRANGVYIPTSCEQGICGTCLTNVIDGLPDHRDSFLTEGERVDNKMILPCCSRAKSARLVLDL